MEQHADRRDLGIGQDAAVHSERFAGAREENCSELEGSCRRLTRRGYRSQGNYLRLSGEAVTLGVINIKGTAHGRHGVRERCDGQGYHGAVT